MKKSLLALAALTLAGAASAQSSVTLFGIVDAAVTRLSAGGKNVTGLAHSGYNTSRLGFRGVEDLGGGLRAGFHIEGALTNDDGNAGGQTWQRRSTVSLLGNFGEVRLGRDYTSSFWNLTVYDAFGTMGVGSNLSIGMLAGVNQVASVRTSNSIGYFLPGNLGGFNGQFTYGFGENVSGGVKTNNHWSGRLGYAAGPISVHGAYGKTEGATDAADIKYMNVGASYDLGVAKPMLLWAREKAGTGNVKVDMFEASVVAPIGQHELRAAYSHYDQKGGSSVFNDADYNLMAIGYAYNLSKRTALFATYARVSNDGASAEVLNSPGVGGLATPAGGHMSGVQFGLRHAF